MEDVLIVAIATIASFGMPVFIVLIVAIFLYRSQKNKLRVIQEIVLAGQPVPEGLFKRQNKPMSWVRQMKAGLIYLAIGLGLLAYFLVASKSRFWGLAMIPVLIGVAYLVTAYVCQKNTPQS